MSNPQTDIPDAAARSAALNTHASFIVQAPAGSGKTTLLANRYINLLAKVQKPEEILAITFTKKAAAEMRHRVLALLRADTEIANQIRTRDTEQGWHLFDNPNVLKIQTIDSFALDIASQVPYQGSAAGLGITEQADEFYSEAANSFLNRLFDDQPSNALIAEFVAFLDNDVSRVERLLTSMLARRDQWLTAVTAVAMNNTQETPAKLIDAAVQALSTEFVEQLQDSLNGQDQRYLATLAERWQLGDPWASIPALMTKAGALRKRLTVKDNIEDTELRRELTQWLVSLHERGLDKLLASFSRLPRNYANDFETVHLCCVCLALAATDLDSSLRRAGLLDFTGLLIRAKQALRDEHGATDLALFLDYRIKHILVDEYQDTSRAQFEFFNLLTEAWQDNDGNTFFAVGDPMQSIYRFRDADVAIFHDSLERGLNQVRLTPIVLEANFRSDPTVIHWCNDAFNSIFGSGGASQLGDVAFSPATAMVASQPHSGVDCLSFPDAAGETAHWVEYINKVLRDEPQSDVAILCRARNHVSDLLAALTANGIALQATDMDLLADKPVIADLMCLHQLLLQPSNRLAWFSLLRSPMLGLPLVELSRFSEVTDFVAYFAGNPPASGPLARLVGALEWAWRRCYEVPLREVLEGMWFRLGGIDAYPQAQWPDAKAWFDLIDDMQNQAYDYNAVARALKVLFASSEHGARVQVMTIHKAKGLEFDHVIVPFLNRSAANDEPPLLQWRATDHGLLMGIRGDDIHQWLAYEERERAKNEEKRLLYVACTRAKRRLQLSYTATPDKRPSGLARWLEPWTEPTAANAANQADDHLLQSELFNIPELKRLPASYDWRVPVYADLDSQTLEPAQDDGANARQEVALGLLIHRALAWMTTSAGKTWLTTYTKQPDSATAQLEARLKRWSLEFSIGAEAQDEFIAQAMAQIELTLNDERGAWILQATAHSQAEWPLSGVYAAQVEHIVVDRCFKAGGVHWIIDYKTASPNPGQDRDTFIRHESHRYAAQLKKYQSMVGAFYAPSDASPVRTALYFTALGHFEPLD